MKKFLILVIIFPILMTGCDMFSGTKKTWVGDGEVRGSNKLATQVHNVADFEGIFIEKGYNVTVGLGEFPMAIITADDNITPLLDPLVVNGFFKVNFSKGLVTKRKISIRVESPQINKIVHNGAGVITIDNLRTPSLTINSNGIGKITGKGEADKMIVDVRSSGEVLLDNFVARECEVSMNGTGKAIIRATQSLTVNNDGPGEVIYTGSPSAVNIKNEEMGTVSHR